MFIESFVSYVLVSSHVQWTCTPTCPDRNVSLYLFKQGTLTFFSLISCLHKFTDLHYVFSIYWIGDKCNSKSCVLINPGLYNGLIPQTRSWPGVDMGVASQVRLLRVTKIPSSGRRIRSPTGLRSSRFWCVFTVKLRKMVDKMTFSSSRANFWPATSCVYE